MPSSTVVAPGPAGSSQEESPTSSERLLASLNEPQRQAVLHERGPLLIFAGAGSGKTRVLTCRLAHLIQVRGEDPSGILAVTFTNKAANEMKERVRHLIGDRTRGIWIGTFHAICARLLRAEIVRLGYDKSFVVFDDGDQQSTMRDAIRSLNLDMETYPPRGLLNVVSREKEKLIDEHEFERRAVTPSDKTLSRVYHAYQQRLRESNALDFDDLIRLSVKLLEECPDVRERYQARFRHILVDEFQDVNHAQYRLIELLAEKSRNLVCVGDDDQSIYGWRGADVRLILRLESDFPDITVIKLEQNYRSTQSILDCANQVVRFNRTRRAKQLWTANIEGDPVMLDEGQDDRDEARRVVDRIFQQGGGSRRPWSDFAVLYRTNSQSRVLEETLRSHQIPYRLVGGQRFYERKEVKDLISYLRVIYNPEDRPSTLRALATPSRGIGQASIEKLSVFARQEGVSLYAAMLRADEVSQLTARARKASLQFARSLQELRRLQETLPVSALVEKLLENSGYMAELRSSREPDVDDRVQNILEFQNAAQEFERESEDPGLRAFLETLSLASDLDTYQVGENVVTLMTLHAAKGLEFPIVFLVGLEEGLFPHQRGNDSQAALEEERRLCYVGITRARERLFVSYARSRPIMGTISRTRPSRFVDEMKEFLERVSSPRAGQQSFAGLFPSGTERARRWTLERQFGGNSSPRPVAPGAVRSEGPAGVDGGVPIAISFRVGDAVRHAMFGVGLVVQTSADIVSVAFEGKGIKKLQVGVAPLEKVDRRRP